MDNEERGEERWQRRGERGERRGKGRGRANEAVGAQNLNSKLVLTHTGALSWSSWKPLWDLPRPFFSLLQILTMWAPVWLVITKPPHLPHFGSSLSIWHFPSAAKPSPGQVSWAPVPLHCWSSDKESPECPLDIHSTQLWLPQHSSGAGKWAGRFLSSLLAVDKDTSEQEKWRCNPVHVCSWQTEETPTSIEFWVDYPDISLDSNTGLETKHG